MSVVVPTKKATLRRGLAAAILLSVVLASGRASAGPVRAHPYFDDGGTLSWSTDLASAQAAARESGRLILVEYGRRQCCTCKTLVQKVLPSDSLRRRVQGLCVGLAADCDEPEPKVAAIFCANLPGAFLLPFVAVLSPDLEWVTGWSGGKSAEEVGMHLDRGEAFRRSARVAEAKRAAEAGRWGRVVRLAQEAGGGRSGPDAEEWRALLARADAWAEKALADAVAAAKAGRCEEAQRLLDAVEREMPGRWAADDAEVGKKALKRREALEAIAKDAQAEARRAARTEYAGTRWAVLFAA